MFILLTELLVSPEGNIFSVISCVAYLLYILLFTLSSVLCVSFRSVNGGNFLTALLYLWLVPFQVRTRTVIKEVL